MKTLSTPALSTLSGRGGSATPGGRESVDARNYLLVLPVHFFQSPEGWIATESAFALHLRLLRRSLAPDVETLTIAAPVIGPEAYAARSAGWSRLSADQDGIRLIPLHEAGLGRLDFLRQLPRIAWRLWRAVGSAAFVHSGPSELFEPREIVALLFGVVRRRRTIYTVDIDWHGTAAMNLRTKVWPYGAYWRRRYVHDAWAALQTFVARWTMSLLMLKGDRLVRRFGGGAPHVRYLLDAAHSAEMVLTDAALQAKLTRTAASTGTLRAVYFGRLAAYKGVDRMLQAVALTRNRGADVTLDVYGDGAELERLRHLADEAGLQESVRFHGARPYGRAFLSDLSNYDLLLAAPLAQDTPRSAVDAQASGLPVLAYDTYYYQELRDFGAGVTCVPWEDIPALADELIELSNDRGRLCELIRRGVSFARANTQEIWLARRASWTLGRPEEVSDAERPDSGRGNGGLPAGQPSR